MLTTLHPPRQRRRRPPSRTAWAPLLATAVMTCEPAPATEPRGAAFTVRDSAGVPVLVNHRAAWTDSTAWRLSDEPTLRIGVFEGVRPYEFSGVVGATRLSNGTIAVLDEQTKELRYFDSEGRHFATAGGGGEGPGEFTSPGRLQRLPGDTLQVEDHLTRIRYSPEGEHVSQRSFDWTRVKELGEWYLECGAPHFIGDAIIGCGASERWAGNEEGDSLRSAKTYVRIPSDLSRADTIAVVPRSGPMIVWDENHRAFIGPRWLPGGFFAFGRARFVWARPEGYTIEVRDLEGKVLRVIRRTDGMRPPFPEELAPQPLQPRRIPPGISERDLVAADLDDLIAPDSVPLMVDLFVDDANRIWARLSDRSLVDGVWYDVFREDGRYLGHVRLPIRFEPFEIGRDYVLGVSKDELDVEYVEMYRLIGAG